MSDNIECRKEFTVKLSVVNHYEGMNDTVKEKLYWYGSDAGQTNFAYCAGTHIASIIKRLFPCPHEMSDRKKCFLAILNSFEEDRESGDYGKTESEE